MDRRSLSRFAIAAFWAVAAQVSAASTGSGEAGTPIRKQAADKLALPVPVAFVQAPLGNTPAATPDIGETILSGRYVVGMRIVAADFPDVGKSRRIVTPGLTCATDPAFSHDGLRLIFSGRRSSEDHLDIWERGRDDDSPRIVATGRADCLGPVFLPDGRIVYASASAREYEEHGDLQSLSLFAVDLTGGEPERLTFNPSSDFEPTVLPDGRLLYSTWQHVGNHFWPRGVVALMLINSDGTGLFPLTGNHREPWLKRGSRIWGKDRVAFIQADRFDEFGAGTLVATSLNDPFAPYEVLVSKDDYTVSDVAPLPDGRLLLSARPTGSADATFGLYVYADGDVTLVYDDPSRHELSPAVGASRTRPQRRISTVEPQTPYGYLAVLNCYQSDRADEHSAGKPAPAIRKGAVHAVRVIEGIPLRAENGKTDLASGGQPNCKQASPVFLTVPGREDEPRVHPNSATGYIPSRILGEVPPAADGSIYLKVPADRPLRMQLIDRDGFAIADERSWFWVRPNERRICVGCHENREHVPENVVPLATRRAPTDLTDPSTWQRVSFRRDIQPILTANCATTDCHVPPMPTAGLNQTAERLNGNRDEVLADRFGPAYANLLKRQVNKPYAIGGRRIHPGDARSSPLLWMLYGKALAPQYKPAPFERPMLSAHPGPMLPEAQLDLIRKWVDLGAVYDDEPQVGPWPYRIPVKATVVMEGISSER